MAVAQINCSLKYFAQHCTRRFSELIAMRSDSLVISITLGFHGLALLISRLRLELLPIAGAFSVSLTTGAQFLSRLSSLVDPTILGKDLQSIGFGGSIHPALSSSQQEGKHLLLDMLPLKIIVTVCPLIGSPKFVTFRLCLLA